MFPAEGAKSRDEQFDPSKTSILGSPDLVLEYVCWVLAHWPSRYCQLVKHWAEMEDRRLLNARCPCWARGFSFD